MHIRDTMLLAPGGSKRLEDIGRLYGEGFEKISISQKDYENMGEFLKRDIVKFEEYAVRDALITLVHCYWMEDFVFNLGGSSIPISLSTIGRRFVKKS